MSKRLFRSPSPAVFEATCSPPHHARSFPAPGGRCFSLLLDFPTSRSFPGKRQCGATRKYNDLPNRPKNTATSRQPSAFFLSSCLSRPSLSVPPCAPLPQTLRAQQDFELTPGLVSREHAHNIYVQLAYPNETLLTLKLVAARERPLGPRAVALRNAKEGEGGE